ncbi:hypothetical protein FG167_13615 [Lacinutrix sp. WUR7]|uniref:hypothetical protein n=1 Tax=Lacinutrix sp. WUR7 TaxID=2653681 RepID=UPI00193DF683|nr:hypothetical protein [Lacinutrix sp. WUR7]QRM90228.1 hypothetical protein FG167_13615 [Lacinutrix sp. WUR7]
MKIFRKIRRTLVASGKTKNYLLYAFGEILLIVIGILIAWKINSINEIRKNRIVELKIYQSLNEELNANLVLLDSSIVRYAHNVQTIQNTIQCIRSKSYDLSDALKEGIIDVNHQVTKLQSGAINSVSSTNKFEFIESDLLRDLIASYPNELNNFENQELKIGNIVVNRLQPVIESHISLIDILLTRNVKYSNTEPYSKQTDYNKLLNSRDYQNVLVDRLIQTESQLTIANNLRDKTQIIAFKLNKELEN